MTKREEIREGIDTSIQFVLTTAYLAGKTGESLDEVKERCTSYLKKELHSQGVVIKVERELPRLYTDGVLRNDGRPLHLGYEKSGKQILDEMLEAGFVAVEPLIIGECQ